MKNVRELGELDFEFDPLLGRLEYENEMTQEMLDHGNRIWRQGMVSTIASALVGLLAYVGSSVDSIRPIDIGGYPPMAVVGYKFFPRKIFVDTDSDGSYETGLRKYLEGKFNDVSNRRKIRDHIYSKAFDSQ